MCRDVCKEHRHIGWHVVSRAGTIAAHFGDKEAPLRMIDSEADEVGHVQGNLGQRETIELVVNRWNGIGLS